MAAEPRISVLIPLQDEREAGVDCLRAWVDGQSARPDSYELVVVAIGEDPVLERTVRPLLRDRDRWIERPGIDEYEALDVGAEAASGEYVFLTEAHCVPEHDCLDATLEELDRNGANGVRIRSIPETRGPFGALELEGVHESEQAEEDPGHWRKVLIHGTAIRRDVYLDAGGVPSRYGDFAPWVLSMSLDERGQRPGFSAKPRVSHVYDGDFEKMGACVRSFMAGEVRYREEHPTPATDTYLGWAGEWEGQLEHTRAGAFRALRAAVRTRRGTPASLIRYAFVGLLGPRASIALARFGAVRAARRAQRESDPERRRKSFREFWLLTGRRGRLEAIAEMGNGLRALPAAGQRIELTEPQTGRVIGFHQPERPAGEPPFRWTAPLSILRVNVPGNDRMRARLELRPMESTVAARPRIAVDNRIVPAQVSESRVEFELDGGERWIALATTPLRPRKHGVDDERELGLPVRSLSFEPSGSETGR
jgi:hypothetical protein